MSRIGNAFDHGKAFIGFVTGGDPSMKSSEEFIEQLIQSGVDLIEIGVPFSDPIAEGPVIQSANLRALAEGTTTDSIFHLVGNIRNKTEVPVVLLTYLNPVFKYGYERFFGNCKKFGVDGIIIPDLPFEERHEVSVIADKFGIDLIVLVAPTSKERIRKIASVAKGFVYIVSSMGVTGMRSEITTDLAGIIETVKEVTKVPTAVGFGINTPEQARKIAKLADGVIVGSAIVKIIEEHKDNAGAYLYEFGKGLTDAIKE